MNDVGTALYSFFSSFDLPAFVEYNVPEDTELPYITYELIQPDWKSNQILRAHIWYRDSSFTRVTAKVRQMRQAIGEGISFTLENGSMQLYADSAWAQAQPVDDEPGMKCIALTFVIQVLSY